MLGTGSHSGRVTQFDPISGLGTIESDHGSYAFHCLEIADGTRSIAPGQGVWFRSARKLGRSEAFEIKKSSE
jgi:CspA family cold shock protein